jgi:hypothetical protein
MQMDRFAAFRATVAREPPSVRKMAEVVAVGRARVSQATNVAEAKPASRATRSVVPQDGVRLEIYVYQGTV